VPNLGPHQEWRGEVVKPQSWYSPAFEIRNGTVKVPEKPGLGVDRIQPLNLVFREL
jgi:L-alanine-DL-glutamate epimerase-like enolase superfamily enzyme